MFSLAGFHVFPLHVCCTSAEGNAPRGVPPSIQGDVDAAETPSDGLMPQSHLASFTLLHGAAHHMVSFLGLGHTVSDTRAARAAMLQNKGNPPCGRTPTVIATLACGLGHTVSDPRSRTHGLGHTVSDTRSRTHGLGRAISDTWPSG
jgi:hypothetical protein